MLLAWGDWTFFDHPARVILCVTIGALTLASLFSGMSGFRSGKREDKKNRWIFVPFLALSLAFAWLAPWSDRHDFWTLDGDFVRYLGVGLFVVGGIFRVTPIFVLGRRFSPLVAIQEGHTLVKTGLYRVIRHPSYLGLSLGLAGWACVFRSMIGLFIGALFIPLLVVRMNAEEVFLATEFGNEYENYCRRTWRLIPFLY